MIILRIKKKEFEAIRSGQKKNEWRSPSLYNKQLLLKKNEEGKYTENIEPIQIRFVNGYKKDSPSLIVETEFIRPVKFKNDVDEPENLFKAKAGECAILIKISKIIS